MCWFKRRKKVGLALGGGGPRGLAHIGVIKVLLENGVHIDYIAGTSIGSVVGGMYAKFQDIHKVENFFNKLTYKDLVRALSDVRFAHGVIKGERALKLFRSWVGNTKIERLPIPFKAVATDLATGETIILDRGDLASAVRASSSIPVFFKPFKIGKRFLVDGGNSVLVPVDIVKDMGADIVIAVDLDHCYISKRNQPKNIEKMSITHTAERALDILSYSLAKNNTKNADIIITPDVFDVGWKKFVNGGEIITEGERATEEVIHKIKRLRGL